MTIETSNFAVRRKGTVYKVSGQEIIDGALQEDDIFVVHRGNDRFKFEVPSLISADGILDDDLLACTDTDDVTYKVTGAQFKELFGPPEYDEEVFTRCVNERFLDLIDCKNGCDSQYCTSKCPELFYINLENNCSPLAPWYDDSMSILEIFAQVNPGLVPGTASVVVPNPSIVTVINGVFYLDGVAQPSLSLNRFENIVFDQTDPSNDGHPLRIYEDEARTIEVTNGVRIKNYDNGGLPDPESDSADLRGLIFLALTPGTYYYQCSSHAGMGGTITVTEVST